MMPDPEDEEIELSEAALAGLAHLCRANKDRWVARYGEASWDQRKDALVPLWIDQALALFTPEMLEEIEADDAATAELPPVTDPEELP